MAAVIARPPPFRQSPTPPPHSPTFALNASRYDPVPVPNKHLQSLSPGSPPPRTPETPPASPPNKQLSIRTSSILYPPNTYISLSTSPPVYTIDADGLAAAVEHIASQPLPEPKQVFPWLHGLHPDNQVQQAFFAPPRRSSRRSPSCMRGITIVKAGGDVSHSKLKGAIAPDELLPEYLQTQSDSDSDTDSDASFPEIDPRQGFSVRNFQIQIGKVAMVSDVVVYGDDETDQKEVIALARRLSKAQALLLEVSEGFEGRERPSFNTFVLSSRFQELASAHPEMIALDSRGQCTGEVMDFFNQERVEMCAMTRASEISKNVWLGPTPDSSFDGADPEDYDIFIEASDVAPVPERRALKRHAMTLDETGEAQHLDFPSSGSVMPPSWTDDEIEGIVNTCRWMYEAAHSGAPSADETDADGDSQMSSTSASQSTEHKILLHCMDGYTETSLLALMYFVFAECVPINEAWLRLHCEKQRNFFTYPSDVALLTAIQPRLLRESPRQTGLKMVTLTEPAWLARMDGSLPSRILPYMYLGNLGHANNPELLHALGIKQVLSVGETVSWSRATVAGWGRERLLFVDRVQDNGIDPLTGEFSRCLDFIEQGRSEGTATLVHCRVGVSRSATICIAEVMKALRMSFPRAYCFVRARRLNVIIQPHLRFAYELLKWEERQQISRGEPLRRELEWATIAREIALMNRPYSR